MIIMAMVDTQSASYCQSVATDLIKYKLWWYFFETDFSFQRLSPKIIYEKSDKQNN